MPLFGFSGGAGAVEEKIVAMAMMTETQQASSGAENHIQFDKFYVNKGNFTMEGSKIYVPKSGFYRIYGRVLAQGGNDRRETIIAVNDTYVANSIEQAKTGDFFDTKVHAFVKLNQGDYVELLFEHMVGGDITVFGLDNVLATILVIEKVSD